MKLIHIVPSQAHSKRTQTKVTSPMILSVMLALLAPRRMFTSLAAVDAPRTFVRVGVPSATARTLVIVVLSDHCSVSPSLLTVSSSRL